MKVILIQGLLAPYRYPIFEELGKTKGWDFHVWFMGKKVKNRIWNEKTLKEYDFKYRFLKGLTLNWGFKDINPFWINTSILKELVKHHPDVVIMMGWDSLTSFLVHWFCKKHHIKFVLYADSTPLELSWRRTLTHGLVKLHVGSADALIAGGSRSRNYLESLGGNPNKIYVSHNTVDIDKYISLITKAKTKAKELRNELGIGNNQVILYYGQLIERKGVDLLLSAFKSVQAQYPLTRLLIVGDGPYKPTLLELIQTAGIKNVTLLKTPGDAGIVVYYALANVFVLPSREDVWGLVVNEAMTAGLPIIVSDHAGCAPDLITQGVEGFIFKSGSVKDLSRKMAEIIGTPELRRSMSRASYQKILQFNPKETTDKFRDAVSAAQGTIYTKVNFRFPARRNFLSVIIPEHADPVGLKKTLASLKNQKNAPNFEVIVEHDEKGEGSYQARNRTLERSRGEWIACIDSASLATPQWLSIGAKLLKHYDYVGGPITRGKSSTSSWASLFGEYREFAVKEFYHDAHFFPTTNLFVKRRVIEELGGFDARLISSGDREFGERVMSSRRFTSHYESSLEVIHPLRSYAELMSKQKRLARGSEDISAIYPQRFKSSKLKHVIALLLPPVWLLTKPSFQERTLSEKIKLFLLTYHLSIIHHAEAIRYVSPLAR